MSAKFMLDTDISSYIIKNNPASVVENFKKHKNGELLLSVISYGELQYGALHRKNIVLYSKIKLFVNSLVIINFDEVAAEHYAQIRHTLNTKGTPLDDTDIQIAACALSAHANLITNNAKHFSKIPNLKTKNWI
jgi:tRNA(fMet)-specific endonuclease VapC